MKEQSKNNLLLAAGGVGALLAARAIVRHVRAFSFAGKTVIVTGGSRGLGLVMSRQLVDEGARVAICARDAEELQRAQRELTARGRKQAEVFAAACDISDRAQVDEFVRKVRHRFGSIDVLINNAGIIQVGPFETMTIADFEEAMRINFWGALYMTMAVLPDLKRKQAGGIINISSFGGKISVPHLLPYSASKFALNGLSEGLRSALAKDGITVTTVMPGLMRTGSHVNVDFKGQAEDEFAWFTFGAATPVLSMKAERAAAQILDAFKQGRAQIILTLQANLAIKFHALFPELTGSLLALVNRLLPASAPGKPKQRTKGRDIKNSPLPEAVKAHGAAVARRNNERK